MTITIGDKTYVLNKSIRELTGKQKNHLIDHCGLGEYEIANRMWTAQALEYLFKEGFNVFESVVF